MGLVLMGSAQDSGRSVFLAESQHIEDLPRIISLPSPGYTLLLAYDAENTASHLGEALAEILRSGCVYLCAWGPGCEHVHDTMDDVALEQELAGHPEGLITTTWHATESLEDTAKFALEWANPDDTLVEGCSAVVLAAVGNHEWTIPLQAVASRYISKPISSSNRSRRSPGTEER